MVISPTPNAVIFINILREWKRTSSVDTYFLRKLSITSCYSTPNLYKFFAVHGFWSSVFGSTEFCTRVCSILHVKCAKGRYKLCERWRIDYFWSSAKISLTPTIPSGECTPRLSSRLTLSVTFCVYPNSSKMLQIVGSVRYLIWSYSFRKVDLHFSQNYFYRTTEHTWGF